MTAPKSAEYRGAGEILTPEDVFTWAESFTNLERGTPQDDMRSYRLDRMRGLLSLFGDPDRRLRIIHVAGTKGKGSTSALLASVLAAAGRRTGLYTSPHVSTPFERIAIPGEPRRPDLVVRLGRKVRETIDGLPVERLPGGSLPTTFELLTLLAFMYFQEAGCQEAVVETGIGGRLDATNVVSSAASVITPLDLEHTELLGDTIEKIAFEKAGIIRPGAPAFVGLQPPKAVDVFRNVCRERGSSLTFLGEEARELSAIVDPLGTSLTLRIPGEEQVSFRLSMLGEFQGENAALAYLTLRRTRPEITRDQIAKGLRAVTLPGRMELRGSDPPIVLDGAHTPLAVTRLLSAFRAIFPGEAVLLFGSVSGKNPREMARIMAPSFTRIIVSTPGTFKESNPEEVAGIFRGLNPRTLLEKDPERALQCARDASSGTRPILVTGSFYMVAEIQEAPRMSGFFEGRLIVAVGDITRLSVDAIVNAANSSLMGGGGVDGAIHRAGGPAILQACREVRSERFPDGLPAGDAVETTTGRLPARYVIHTVGPVWHGGSAAEEKTLQSCYVKSLEIAERLGLNSIAFPAISTGVYGFPRERAAAVVWKTLGAWLSDHQLPRTVTLEFYSQDDERIFLSSAGSHR